MSNNDIIIPGDEAYLTFGGWAKPMPNPPGLHERRRYVVDVECTDASLKTSSKGERGTRSLSILRVTEVKGAVVPAKSKNDDEGDDTPPMFNDDGTIRDEASADEGDEYMAARREKAEQEAENTARAEAEDADNGTDQDLGEPWPGDVEADADAAADPDNEPPAAEPAPDNVAPMFRAAGDE